MLIAGDGYRHTADAPSRACSCDGAPAQRRSNLISGAIMEPAPVKNSMLKNIGMAILLTPFGIGFIIAACLSAGPSEVYKALRQRD